MKVPLRTVISVLAVSALVAAILMIVTSQPRRAETVPQQTPPTAPRSQQAVVSGSGLVEPSSETVTIGVVVPGLVMQVAVRPGDRVAKGDLLFRLDDRDARAQVAERQATVVFAGRSLASARVDLAAAERQLALYTNVEDRRAIAEQQVIDRRAARDQAAARVAVAGADVGRARAALASAEVEVARRVVRAPRAGEILQVRTRAGQFAAAGDTSLVAMGETRPLHVRVDIDETEVPRLGDAASATVSPRGDASRRVTATFVRVEPQIVPKKSLTNDSGERVDVRVMQRIYALPSDAAGFSVGQQVDAFIAARRR